MSLPYNRHGSAAKSVEWCLAGRAPVSNRGCVVLNRRITALAALALSVGGVGLAAASASADEHEAPLPHHSHMLLLGATIDFSGEEPQITYDKCVDLASNQALKLHAHHEHLHFGRAGEAQRAAGHVIVPTAPAFGLPWANCEQFATFYPPNA